MLRKPRIVGVGGKLVRGVGRVVEGGVGRGSRKCDFGGLERENGNMIE